MFDNNNNNINNNNKLTAQVLEQDREKDRDPAIETVNYWNLYKRHHLKKYSKYIITKWQEHKNLTA